ncbi:hypothetical protein ABZ707_08445 [Streptomyces sp. NPDC006923]|uniref:hypothetical protein n=1 Tax=Streptomyces sp. NPDC006923 TaxID=3155355 RepID=UPI0033CADED5
MASTLSDWTAIRVPRILGLTVMDILGTRCGAALENGRSLYRFVPTGVGSEWDVTNTITLDPVADPLTIPPPRRIQGPGRTGVCVRVSVTTGGSRAVALLRAAIEDALGPTPGGQS